MGLGMFGSNFKLVIFLFFLLVQTGCLTSGFDNKSYPSLETANSVEFNKVQEIFNRNCTSCHSESGSASFLNLSAVSESQLVSLGILSPGSVDESKILYRTKGYVGATPGPANMPLDRDMPSEDYATLVNWVTNLGKSEKEYLPMASNGASMALLTKSHIQRTLDLYFGITSNLDFFENSYRINNLNERATVHSLNYFSEYFDYTVKIVYANLTKFVDCSVAEINGTCLKSSIAKAGAKLFRRNLTDAEIEKYYAIAISEGAANYELGAAMSMVALLNSPTFLYQKYYGTDGLLNPRELGSRLSFFLIGTNPDEPLLADMNTGAILNKDVYESHVDRLLAKKSVMDRLMNNFMSEYWQLNELDETEAANSHAADLANLESSLKEEFRRNIEAIRSQGDWRGIFSYNSTFLNKKLFDHYGFSGLSPENDSTWVSYPLTEKRSGLLSTGLVFAAHSGTKYSSATHRGIFIVSKLLCEKLKSPPSNIDELAEQAGLEMLETDTVRERADKMATTQPCAGCHQQFDPFGLVFSNFDPLGKYYEIRYGEPVNSSVTIAEKTVENSKQLAETILSNPTKLADCFARNLAYFSNGKFQSSDVAMLNSLGLNIDESYQFSKLVRSIATHETFKSVGTTEGGL